ncbi:desmethyl-deoxy-podophyllotoxin synthase-like isoform X2 [Carex rostrata]
MTSIYLLLSILLLLFIKAKFTIAKHRHRLPPGPWTLPFIGSLHHLICSGIPHRAFRNLSKRYGPIMFLQIGEWPTIVISSREEARMIIKTHEATFRNRPDLPTAKIFSYGGNDVAFLPYSEQWREIRKILTAELLGPKRVQFFRSIREEEVLDLIQVISSLPSYTETVNLSEIMTVMVNKVSVRAVTGRKSNEETHLLMVNELQLSGMLSAGFSMADLFPSSRVIRLMSRHVRRVEECHQSINQLLENMIQEHQGSAVNGEAESLLSVVLRLHAENSISMDTAKAIIFVCLGATNNTGALLEWVMSELVRNPRVMKKAQEEVRRLRGRKMITELDLAELDYLHNVVKETLRLHPVIPLIPRLCQETSNIFGHEISKGTTVVVNVWAIGMDSKYWKDAEEFKPERFSGENSCESADSKVDFELFPFGAGRRNCPGESFSSVIVEVTVANLLYHFNWELPFGLKPDELDMTETSGAHVGRKYPLLLHAVPHHSSG